MIHHGHVIDVLRGLPEKSVHTVVTSPPYWALRNYKTPAQVWPDGWEGPLGLEPTPDLFVAHLVAVFAEVRRVLRDDGTVWLNMGDCYNAGTTSARGGVKEIDHGTWGRLESEYGGGRANARDLKPKDLVGIPWMLAFALRADGWYLRAENIWAKGLSFCPSYAGSVMPESVTDRPTRSHEQVFLLSKSKDYFYDYHGVKENGVYPAGTLAAKGSGTREGNRRPEDYAEYDGKRNLRTVWAIGVEPFREAHFATFPLALVTPCVIAGSSSYGACSACGAPYERIVEMSAIPDDVKAEFEAARSQTANDHGREDGFTTRRPNFKRTVLSEKWLPTCDHDAPVVPAVVMDPFAGSGTVGVVCGKLLRTFVGIELNPAYVEMAERRISGVAPLFTEGAQTDGESKEEEGREETPEEELF